MGKCCNTMISLSRRMMINTIALNRYTTVAVNAAGAIIAVWRAWCALNSKFI
jgi:hypothetical protein